MTRLLYPRTLRAVDAQKHADRHRAASIWFSIRPRPVEAVRCRGTAWARSVSRSRSRWMGIGALWRDFGSRPESVLNSGPLLGTLRHCRVLTTRSILRVGPRSALDRLRLVVASVHSNGAAASEACGTRCGTEGAKGLPQERAARLLGCDRVWTAASTPSLAVTTARRQSAIDVNVHKPTQGMPRPIGRDCEPRIRSGRGARHYYSSRCASKAFSSTPVLGSQCKGETPCRKSNDQARKRSGHPGCCHRLLTSRAISSSTRRKVGATRLTSRRDGNVPQNFPTIRSCTISGGSCWR